MKEWHLIVVVVAVAISVFAFVASIPTGSITGAAIGNSAVQCNAGYVDSYGCSGLWRQRLYLSESCQMSWKTYEFCVFGCSAGACNGNPLAMTTLKAAVCTEADLQYRCDVSTRQAWHRYANCSLEWKNIEKCKEFCTPSKCTCLSGYTGTVRCSVTSAKWVQWQYKYSDCTLEWRDNNKCDYGCKDGECLKTPPTCTPGYLDEYQCSGSILQRRYQNADCTTVWKDSTSCPDGCKDGKCNEPDEPTKCTEGFDMNSPPSCDDAGVWVQRFYLYEDCTREKKNYLECASPYDGCMDGECKDRVRPAVKITYPADTQTVGGVATVQATATDNVGVAKVEFYLDGALQMTDTAAPYEWAWNTAAATNNAHTLKAMAYDKAENSESQSIMVSVYNENGPTGLIYDFESGEAGWTATGLWHLTDVDSTSPKYSWWYGVERSGNYDEPAGKRNSGSLTTPQILLGNAPKLTFMSFYITEDNGGNKYDTKIVEIFTADDGMAWPKKLMQISDTKGKWNLESVDLSSYAGKAVKIRFTFDTGDGYKNTFKGWLIDDVKIADGSESSDSTPPAVKMTSPADKQTVSGVATVQATATDNVGVARVEFYLDSMLQATDTAAPYAWSWNTASAANGMHTLTAKAYDAAGNKGEQSISVSVSNGGTGNSWDFESGEARWTATGLWHIATRKANSPTHSFWYGQESTGTYDTGVKNSGGLVSPSIALGNAPKLTFMSWYKTETKKDGTAQPAYDKKLAEISIDDGKTWTQLMQITDAPSVWNAESKSLAAYAGKTVKIRFFFNTIDEKGNSYTGWFVDDVKITS